MDAGEAAAAFALLEPLETSRAGDPEYDYLFGIAALDSSNPSRAVFALERVVAGTRLSFVLARLEGFEKDVAICLTILANLKRDAGDYGDFDLPE